MNEAPLPAYLKAAMAASGHKTASELARATGIGEAQISRWLRGQTVPDPPNLRKLARALRRPFLELMVTAGHVEPEEARMKDRPAPPAAEPLDLEQLRRIVLDSTSLDAGTRQAMLDLIEAQERRATA